MSKISLQKVADNLRKRGFSSKDFNTKEDASSYLNSLINNSSVGFGGCLTAKELNLYESLSTHNNCIWHWYLNEKADAKFVSDDLLKSAANADYYISSVNGMSEDGDMILIDGKGNRIASVLYGHSKGVIFIIGRNKIENTYEKALWRTRNIAAPQNAKRANKQTPLR